jgi:hypothetical protein
LGRECEERRKTEFGVAADIRSKASKEFVRNIHAFNTRENNSV